MNRLQLSPVRLSQPIAENRSLPQIEKDLNRLRIISAWCDVIAAETNNPQIYRIFHPITNQVRALQEQDPHLAQKISSLFREGTALLAANEQLLASYPVSQGLLNSLFRPRFPAVASQLPSASTSANPINYGLPAPPPILTPPQPIPSAFDPPPIVRQENGRRISFPRLPSERTEYLDRIYPTASQGSPRRRF